MIRASQISELPVSTYARAFADLEAILRASAKKNAERNRRRSNINRELFLCLWEDLSHSLDNVSVGVKRRGGSIFVPRREVSPDPEPRRKLTCWSPPNGYVGSRFADDSMEIDSMEATMNCCSTVEPQDVVVFDADPFNLDRDPIRSNQAANPFPGLCTVPSKGVKRGIPPVCGKLPASLFKHGDLFKDVSLMSMIIDALVSLGLTQEEAKRRINNAETIACEMMDAPDCIGRNNLGLDPKTKVNIAVKDDIFPGFIGCGKSRTTKAPCKSIMALNLGKRLSLEALLLVLECIRGGTVVIFTEFPINVSNMALFEDERSKTAINKTQRRMSQLHALIMLFVVDSHIKHTTACSTTLSYNNAIVVIGRYYRTDISQPAGCYLDMSTREQTSVPGEPVRETDLISVIFISKEGERKQIAVCGVHARKNSATTLQTLGKRLMKIPEIPALVIGDFNNGQNDATKMIAGGCNTGAFTCAASYGLDHAFVTGPWHNKLRSGKYVVPHDRRSRDKKLSITDHPAVYVQLE
jgi:hypothetical protein